MTKMLGRLEFCPTTKVDCDHPSTFLGSGTTIMAAQRTGRRCYGLELDPRYADTIIRRWQAFTGGSAHHGTTGRT